MFGKLLPNVCRISAKFRVCGKLLPHVAGNTQILAAIAERVDHWYMGVLCLKKNKTIHQNDV